MIFDTDVLIWYLRGNEHAAEAIKAEREREISAVTLMELLQGARDKREQKLIGKFLSDFSFAILPLTENIGHRATIYVEEYGLKGGLQMADALIAATATEYRKPLCTGNAKHYKVVSEVEVKAFRFT
jgi:predicted nucleic acid-binding protein